MHCLLTKPETQAEKLQAGSVLQLLHTSITFFRGDVVSCFPSFLNLNVGFGTYVMQQVNNGLFLLYSKALFPHKYHQEIICLAPKSLLLLFYSMFSLLGSVRHHNISVKKKYLKIPPLLCKEQQAKILPGLLYQHSGLSDCTLLFKQDQVLIILDYINTLKNNPRPKGLLV